MFLISPYWSFNWHPVALLFLKSNGTTYHNHHLLFSWRCPDNNFWVPSLTQKMSQWYIDVSLDCYVIHSVLNFHISTLCFQWSASKAFLHPTYFPLDPFHFFYENNMAFIWGTQTTFSSETEIVHLPTNKAQEFGSLVAKAMVVTEIWFRSTKLQRVKPRMGKSFVKLMQLMICGLCSQEKFLPESGHWDASWERVLLGTGAGGRIHGDTRCTGMNMKVWNTRNKDQVPQEKP